MKLPDYGTEDPRMKLRNRNSLRERKLMTILFDEFPNGILQSISSYEFSNQIIPETEPLVMNLIDRIGPPRMCDDTYRR